MGSPNSFLPMKERRNMKLVILGILMIIALQYPVISLFSLDVLIMGIPALILYLFLVWLIGIIVLIAITMQIRFKSPRDNE